MKKRLKLRAFKILTFAVCLVMTALASGINTFAAASTQMTAITCPFELCTRKLLISGPYGDADDVVDNSIPYLGGRTYEDIYINEHGGGAWYIAEAHMYIVYCTKYSHSTASVFNHTMSVIFPKHGYTVTGYELNNAVTHYTNYICDHNEHSSSTGTGFSLTQSPAGENARLSNEEIESLMATYNTGCGKTKRIAESHSWVYGEWTNKDGALHQRTKTCSLCGYTDAVQQNHNLVYGEWTLYGQPDQNQLDSNAPDSTYFHVRTVTCSECGYTGYEYKEHNHLRDFEGYLPSSNSIYSSALWHYYSVHCSICDHGIIYYSKHSYKASQNEYTDITETQHHVKQTCKDCGWVNEFDENHLFTTDCMPISESKHRFASICKCGHSNIYYGDHYDDDSDCYCDDCGYLMTRFSVTVPATLSLVMDKDGKVYTPTNAVIMNNSTAAVKVTDISLTAKNGWTVVPYSTNMANEKVDSYKIGLKLRDLESDAGDIMPVTGNWTAPKDGNLPLPYSAVVSATSQPIAGQNVLDVTFVIDWSD